MNSTYGQNAFLVMLAMGLGGWFLLLVVTLILLWYGRKHTSHRHETLPKVVVGFLNASFGFLLITFGAISGFDYLHPAASIAITSVLWSGTSILSVFLLFGQWRLSAVESNASHIETSVVSTMLRKLLGMCQKKAKVCNVLCCIGYIVCYVVIFVMYGMCYCTNPFQLTTWASRRSQPNYCFEGEFCHQYVLLGRNYSRVRLVGHVVSELGVPRSTSASLCLWNVASQALDCSSVNLTFPGAVVDRTDTLNEDPRFVSHVFLSNLNASTAYAADVRVVLASGEIVHKLITFRTVPQARSEVTFISGGDLYSTNDGQWLVFIAFAAKSTPSFALFGGDLAYANNLRTCYIRFDYFLALATSLRTAQGLSVPLLIIPGNHESGGYLLEANPLHYHFYLPFFPQYDDDVPKDASVTYHTHDVAHLTILGLDSGTMVPSSSQVSYAEAMLGYGTNKSQTLIAAYHNPMFPSIRDFNDGNSMAVRAAWLNLFLKWNLTLGLEFHDHAYKRTHKVNALSGSSPSNADGITFIGDGGLGTSRDTSYDRPYLAVRVESSNIQIVRAFTNGSLLVTAFGGDRRVIDVVLIAGRTSPPRP
jgi:hypothetical protein